MSTTEKFGRSIRVYLQTGGQTVQLVDWRDGLPVRKLGTNNISLKCSFTVRRSTNPQPHECDLSIWGLSRETRESLIRAYEEAEDVSWKKREALALGKIRIDAGYGTDVATLFVGDLAPDGVRAEPQRPGHVMHLRALDGRIAWRGKFVNRTTSKNVDINTIRGVLASGSDYTAGKDADLSFERNFPSLVKKKKGFPGYESGYAIFGESRKHNQTLCDTLGIVPIFQDGEIRYMSKDIALLDTAVVLSAGRDASGRPGLLLAAQPMGLGRYRVSTLMEHRLRPGRQVFLYDEIGRPIGVGVFRVESMVATGTNRGQAFHVDADLVSTALPPVATNLRPYQGPDSVPVGV